MIDRTKLTGMFEILVRNIKTGKTKHFDIKNRVMDTYLNQLIDTLVGSTPDLEYKWLAVGTNGDAVVDTQTTLGVEIKRVQPSTASTRPSVGKRQMEFILLKADAVALIKEVGIFAGSTATSTVDTGTLVTRILWTYDKSADEEIVIKRIDILGRG